MNPTRRLVVNLAAVWAVLVAAGIVVVAVLPFPPEQGSDVAQSISDTTRLITWLAWPIFSGVVLAIIGAVLVHRRAPDVPMASADRLRGDPRMAGAWVGAVGAVVLALAVFGTLTLSNEDTAESLGLGGRGTGADTTGGHADTTTVEVQVIAQQWQFTYRYPGFGGFESAHLVLPVNANVQFHITSLDVTHSFWAPGLGVKADAVPLHDNTFNVQLVKTGNYRIQCGELCGLWHGAMDDYSTQVVSPGDFNTWVAQQQAADAPIMQYLPPYSHTYQPNPGAYGS